MTSSRDADTAPNASDLRCGGCGKRIGVYEPLMEVRGGLARRTSLAAAPQLESSSGGDLFHAGCYEPRTSLTSAPSQG